MITTISKTEAIKAKLREEGKVSYLDNAFHIAAIVEMNVQMEDVRREFQVKDRNSQTTASTVILTA